MQRNRKRQTYIKDGVAFWGAALLILSACSAYGNRAGKQDRDKTTEIVVEQSEEPIAQPEVQSENTQTNPQEETSTQPDVSSLTPPQSAEREETAEDMQEPEQDPAPIVWPDAALPALKAYRAIMLEGASFVNDSDGELYDIAHIKEITAPYVDYPVEPSFFSLVDLDQDEIPEIILSLSLDMSLILRYEDGIVYCFGFSGRAFNEQRKDGTFWASGGAGDSGICAITFSKNQYTVDEFTYCTTHDSEDRKGKFFVDHQEVSKAEYSLAVDKWREIPYVDWYEYTDENIDTMLSLEEIK